MTCILFRISWINNESLCVGTLERTFADFEIDGSWKIFIREKPKSIVWNYGPFCLASMCSAMVTCLINLSFLRFQYLFEMWILDVNLYENTHREWMSPERQSNSLMQTWTISACVPVHTYKKVLLSFCKASVLVITGRYDVSMTILCLS